MSKVCVCLTPMTDALPVISLGIESTSNCNMTATTLSPEEARIIGLQLKVLADSIERMTKIVPTP